MFKICQLYLIEQDLQVRVLVIFARGSDLCGGQNVGEQVTDGTEVSLRVCV